MRIVSLVLTLATAVGISAGVQRPQAPGITVGPNVQVSAARSGDTHYEVLAAADPKNPSRLIVGSIVYPRDTVASGTVVYASVDGGKSWRPTLGGAALDRTGDPAAAYGPDGSAYYVASLIPATGERTMLLYRSRDGGSTWDAPSTLTYSDREYIAVDATGGRFNGRIYVNGNNRVPRNVSDFVVFPSSDGGRTFSGPGKREAFGRSQIPVMGNAVVASDGTLIGVFGEVRDTSLQPILSAVTSVDGGATLSPAVTIADFFIPGNRKGADNNVNSEPTVAIDASRGRLRDRVYAVWPDRRSGHSQIFFSWSGNKGASWSAARAISDNAPSDTTDQFMPMIAVNRDGVVGVLWYDRRNHPDDLGWDARFTASRDGGATFLPSVAVSEQGTQFDAKTPWTGILPTVTPTSDGATVRVSLNSFMFLGGDTAGLVADATGVFHPVWVDNRTGTPQVWTATVTVSGSGPAPALFQRSAAVTRAPSRAAPPADAPSGQGQRRVVKLGRAIVTPALPTISSSDLRLVITAASYDRATETLSLRAHVENAGPNTQRGPFRVMASSVSSELGDPAIANADDGRSDRGATWSFGNGSIAPGGSSATKTLRITFANIQPFRLGHQYRLGLLDMVVYVTN